MPSPCLSPLYLVTDRNQTRGRDLVTLIRDILPQGGFMVQLRERNLGTRDLLRLAQELLELMRPFGMALLINDRLDLALAVEAEGIHLRSDSLPIGQARKCLGNEKLIGFSAHSVNEVVRGEEEGADFAVLGPIYDSPSKRPYGPPIGLGPLEEASCRCRIPVYAIGGVTEHRVLEVKKAGAFGVAVISSILSSETPPVAVRNFNTQLAVTS